MLTTSKPLTAGVHTKMVKVIAIDQNISSITEFKQIIKQSTRINKILLYFAILDFRNATRHFANDGFEIIEDKPENKNNFPPQKPKPPKTPRKKIGIDNVDVYIQSELHQVVDSNDSISFLKNNLIKNYQRLESCLKEWNAKGCKNRFLRHFNRRAME